MKAGKAQCLWFPVMLDESDILSTTRKQLSKGEYVCQTIGNEYHRVGQVDVISRKRMWHAINCSQLKGPSTFFILLTWDSWLLGWPLPLNFGTVGLFDCFLTALLMQCTSILEISSYAFHSSNCKISPNFIGQSLSPTSLVSEIRISSFSFFSGKTGTIESKEASSDYMSGCSLSSSYVVDSYVT